MLTHLAIPDSTILDLVIMVTFLATAAVVIATSALFLAYVARDC